MVALITAGAEERRIDRTSAAWCLLLLVASASCCCCILLLQHAAAAAAAAGKSCCCATAPPASSSAADVASVYFPDKNPIFSLFSFPIMRISGKSSVMTIFPTEILVNKKLGADAMVANTLFYGYK